MLKKTLDYIKHGVWEKDENGVGRSGWFVRPFKIALYAVRGIGKHNIGLRAAGLTYYTVMSLVPILAMVFGILKGFGFDENLQMWLNDQFPGYESAVNQVMVFVGRILDRTRGGLIAGVGIFVLLWSVIQVFNNIENAFNQIWEVHKPRSIARKFTDYMAVIFVAPILLITSIGLTTAVKNLLSWLHWDWLLNVLLWLLALVLMWGLFIFVYWLMPNTKVKFKGAAIAALLAGTAFFAFQKFYFLVQSQLSAYNAIYGTFAAIPLFLVWISTSWQIVLIGAELSFAYQNIERYEYEREAAGMNLDNRRKVLLATMLAIARHYTEHDGAVTSEQVADELGLPLRVVRDAIFELEKVRMVLAVKNERDPRVNRYVPARDVNSITVYDVLNSVERDGSGHMDVSHLPQMQKVSELLDDMKEKAFSKKKEMTITELL